MGRTDWEPVVVTALVAIGTVWWYQSWCFVLEVLKVFKVLTDQLNYLGIFEAGNDFDLATAVFKDLDIEVEDAFESLHPGHGSLALCGALVTPAGIGYFSVVWLPATLSRRDLISVFVTAQF